MSLLLSGSPTQIGCMVHLSRLQIKVMLEMQCGGIVEVKEVQIRVTGGKGAEVKELKGKKMIRLVILLRHFRNCDSLAPQTSSGSA